MRSHHDLEVQLKYTVAHALNGVQLPVQCSLWCRVWTSTRRLAYVFLQQSQSGHILLMAALSRQLVDFTPMNLTLFNFTGWHKCLSEHVLCFSEWVEFYVPLRRRRIFQAITSAALTGTDNTHKRHKISHIYNKYTRNHKRHKNSWSLKIYNKTMDGGYQGLAPTGGRVAGHVSNNLCLPCAVE